MPMYFPVFIFFKFIFRFILAFSILAYSFSKDKSDANLRNGMTMLLVFGSIVLVLLVVLLVLPIPFVGLRHIFGMMDTPFFHPFS